MNFLNIVGRAGVRGLGKGGGKGECRAEGTTSSDVLYVGLGAKYLHQLVLVVVDVALHDLHARTKQAFKCLHVQDWNKRNYYYIA